MRVSNTCPTVFLLLCSVQCVDMLPQIISCNYRPWFGDTGLVAQLILEESNAVYNASLPDSLESCAEQLQAKSRRVKRKA
jgi:hypothetical protein